MPEPHQLGPLDVEEQRLYSELLPSDWAPHPISKGAPSHAAKKANFGRLYPGSCPPQLMTIGESRNVDWPVNRELRLAAQLLLHHDRPVHRPHYCRSCTDPSVNLPFHPSLHREYDPEILKLLHLRQEHSTMASDLEVLIVIPAASHSVANHPSAWRRSRSEQGPTRQHHPQKAETKSCGPQTGHPPALDPA